MAKQEDEGYTLWIDSRDLSGVEMRMPQNKDEALVEITQAIQEPFHKIELWSHGGGDNKYDAKTQAIRIWRIEDSPVALRELFQTNEDKGYDWLLLVPYVLVKTAKALLPAESDKKYLYDESEVYALAGSEFLKCNSATPEELV